MKTMSFPPQGTMFPITLWTLTAWILTVSTLGAATFEADIESALDLHEKAESVAAEVEALERFKALSAEYPEEWLPPYWAAYLCTQIARLDGRADDFPEDLNGRQLIRDAQTFFDQAARRKSDPSPEMASDLHMLQGFIHMWNGLILADTEDDKEKYRRLRVAEYESAVRLNPRNPLMYVISATGTIRRDAASFHEVMAAIALLDRAEEIFGAAPARGLTTHWNQEWIPFWKPEAEKRLAQMLEH